MPSKTYTIKVNIMPFIVPNFVTVEAPSRSGQKVVGEQESLKLCALDEQTLYELCDDFTNAVFAKAGKQRPSKPTP